MRLNLSEIMPTTSPEIYYKYIIINKKGETVIYVKDINSIYGIMKA